MLLLVDDQEAKILELDGFAQQRMGADDDVDLAAGDAVLGLLQLGAADQARRLRDLHRQSGETLLEGAEMLARQQRRRHHDRHLLARERDRIGGAQRHLGLAEADIAADQPVHDLAGGQIVEDRRDGGELVLGLVIGEARRELVIGAGVDVDRIGLHQEALRRDLDQLLRHVADALLELGFLGLPGDAAELVEHHLAAIRAVAAQQLDVLDRQIEFGVVGILDLDAIMRRAHCLDLL